MKNKETAPSSERYNIQVLQKALRLLDTLLEARRPLNLEALSEGAQTPKSTAFRIVTNLLKEGYLTETPDGYWLGLKLLSLGTAVEAQLDVRQVAAPFITQLRDETGETVYLATLTQDLRVLYLERAPSTQPIAVNLKSAGMTADAHGAALGKVMLAFQPEAIREQWLEQVQLEPLTPNTITDRNALRQELHAIYERGYGIDDEEFIVTICCIAAPIFDARRKVVGAISIAGPKPRMPRPLVGSLLADQVTETARRISVQMGLSENGRRNGNVR
jgi:DNA-binding IclR family transcriptional regulator